MGVRLALGTTPIRLRSVILRQGVLMVVAGAIPGIAGAQLTGRFLGSVIAGAKPVGPGDVRWADFVPRSHCVGEYLVRQSPHRQVRYH
jgi:ABC-type antimicrobial peptide transport system permease subunit